MCGVRGGERASERNPARGEKPPRTGSRSAPTPTPPAAARRRPHREQPRPAARRRPPPPPLAGEHARAQRGERSDPSAARLDASFAMCGLSWVFRSPSGVFFSFMRHSSRRLGDAAGSVWDG